MSRRTQLYKDMLAGRGLAVGDTVVCDYRTPSSNQWWIHPFWVGVIEDVSEDVPSWNGHNSEERYCHVLKYVKVRYLPGLGNQMESFTRYDDIGHIRQLHFCDGIAGSPSFNSEASGYSELRTFAAKC